MTVGLRVVTGSRLHFGLLGWGPQTRRQFGSVGLMVDSPQNILEAHEAEHWSAVGPLAARLLSTARHIAKQLSFDRPLAIRVVESAPEHSGLGTGTQLSLASSLLVAAHAGYQAPSVAELAAWTGRGRRSGIGLHGFFHGGLLVDGGRKASSDPVERPPPLIARAEWPADWSILVVIPPIEPGLHGPEETRAFDELPPMSSQQLDRIGRLVLLELLPALAESDLDAFGGAIEELQQHVGTAFAPAQGGVYAEPALARIADAMRDAGLKGVGQSSWGPAIYGISKASLVERTSIAARLIVQLQLAPRCFTWTRVKNSAAHVESAD